MGRVGFLWKSGPNPGPDLVIYITTKIPSYIYIYIAINPNISLLHFISAHLQPASHLYHSHSQISISLTLNLTFGQLPNLSSPVQLSPPSQAFIAVLRSVNVTVYHRSRFVLFCLGSLWFGTFGIVREFGFFFFFFFLRIWFGFVIFVLGFVFVFVFVILKVKIKNLKFLYLFLGF